MNVPNVAKGKLAPGMACTSPLGPYLPLRAPSKITPANAAVAPAKCTIPEPAKSLKAKSSARLYKPNTSFAPQVHEPSIG